MADFDSRYDDFAALGRGLAFVSTDSPEAARRLQEEMSVRLALVCDVRHATLQAWNLYNASEHGGIAKPAVFALSTVGTIELRRLGGLVERPTADSVLQALTAISNEEPTREP